MMKNLNRIISILFLVSIGLISNGVEAFSQVMNKPGRNATKVEKAWYYGTSSLKGGDGTISVLPESLCSTDAAVDIYVDAANLDPARTDIVWTVSTGAVITGDYEEHNDWVTPIGSSPDNGISLNPATIPSDYYGVNITIAYQQSGTDGSLDNTDLTVVNKTPTALDFTQSTTVCNGSYAIITLPSAENGTYYNLYRGVEKITSSAIRGNGSDINFYVNESGTYTVKGFDSNSESTSTCFTWMTGSATVVVYDRPTGVISGGASLCENESTDITINFTGASPYDVTYLVNGGDPVTVTGVASPYTFTVTPTPGSYTYTIQSITDNNNCTTTATDISGSAVVNVGDRPTGVISGSTTICNGVATDLTFTLTGTGPWDIVYSDGSSNFNVTANSSPYNVSVTPSSSTTYTIVSITDQGATCDAIASEISGSAEITVNESPTAVISGTTTICNGESTDLSISFTGVAPWDVTYNDGSTDISLTGITSNPYTFSVNPASNTTYTLVAVDDAICSAVPADLTGSAAITVNTRPTGEIVGDAEICNGESTDITFNLTGLSPWDLTYNDGTDHTITVNSSPFVLTVSPSSTTVYTITGLVDGQCTSLAADLTGSATVTVNPRPTGVISGTTTICNGDNTQLTFALTGEAPWNLVYNDGTSDYTVNNINSSPFDVTVAPTTGTTYTLVSISDNNTCAAEAGDMSGSAIISVDERPTAVISGTVTICNGDDANLTVNLTGTPPWNITYNDGSDHVINNINSTPYNLVVSPSADVTYTITSLSDANCTATALDLSGSGIVNVNSRPTGVVSGNATICNGESTNVSFTLTGVGPWNLTYNDGTSDIIVNNVNSNPYIINVSPSETTVYSLVALSDQQCTSVSSDLSGTATVTVNERPTGVLTGNTTICNGESADLTFTLTGNAPWDLTYNDGVDHTVTVNSSPYVLNVSPNSTTSYQIVSLSDASLCSAQASEMTGVVTVNVNPRPQGTISGDNSICVGESTDLTLNLVGTAPWTITYNDGSTDYTLNNISSNPYVESVTPSSTAVYTIVALSDALCTSQSSDLTGSAAITVNMVTSNLSVSAPSAGATTVCAGVDVTFNAAGSDGSGSYSYDFHRIRSGVDASVHTGSSTYTTPDLQDGDQIYVITTDNNTLCTDNSDVIVMTINANPVPVLNITSAGGNEVCSETTVDFVASSGYDRYIFYRNGTEVLQDGTANTLSTTILEDGDYVTVEAYDGSCHGASTSITMSINPLPTITLVSDETTVCENEVVTFTATGSGSGSLTYQFLVNGTPQTSQTTTNTFTWSSTSDFSVEAIVFDGNNCEEISSPIAITISKPIATLISDKTIICENEEIVFTAGGGDNYEFFIDGTSIQGPGVTNVFSSTTLENNDNITVQVTDSYGCTATHAGISVTVNPIPVVSLSSSDLDNTICQNDEVTITATGGDVYEFFVNGVSVQGPDGNDEYVTTVLNDGDQVSAIVSYSTSGCSETTSIISTTVNPLPTASLNVSPSNSIISGTDVTFTASGGTEYVYSVNGVVVQVRSSTTQYSSDLLVDGDVVTVDVYDGNDCMSSESITMSVFDSVILLDVMMTEPSYCEGGTGVSVYLAGTPQDGVTYELMRTSDNSQVGASIMFSSGDPVNVRWDNVKGTDEYRVEAYYISVPGERFEMNKRVTITEYPLPIIYNLTPTGSVTGCNGGSGHVISLDNSQPDIKYTLYLNDVVPVEVLMGNGAQLEFGAQLGIGTYTVLAESLISGCQRYMSGTFSIEGEDLATNLLYVVNPAKENEPTDGRYCQGDAGVELALDGSLDNTVTYKLYLDGNDTGTSVLGNNGPLSFGIVSIEGVYTANIETSTGCQLLMDGYADVTAVPTPTQFNVVADNDGHYCEGESGVAISIDSQEEGVEYNLYLDGTTLIETLTGSDALGTPLFFSGLHTTEGIYSVQASVPQVGCSSTMNNTIEVQIDALPTVFDLTSDGDYCSGSTTYIHLPGSESNVDYRWHNLDDGSYGSAVTGTGGVLDIEITGSGNYEIVAIRNDGVTSCSSVMNGTFAITEKPLPDVTKIISETYEGTGCDDGSIVTVILSEVGVEYTLVKKVGLNYYDAGLPTITGDGNDISFDPIVDKDNAEYTAMADLNGCIVYLNNSVFIDITGVITKQIVTGSGEICNGDPGVVFGLDDSESGVTYELWLADTEGSSTGTLKESVTGDGTAISFNSVNEEGEYFVMGISSSCTLEMANRVELNVNPLPEAYKMIGSGEYCDITEGALISLDNSEEGVSYMLQFNDGTNLRNALSTAAIGGALTDTIDFGRFTDIGTYTVIATTDKGCTSSMNGFVTTQLSTAPVDQTVESVTSLYSYCESDGGVELQLLDHESDVVYQVIDELTNTVVAEITDEDPSASGIISLGVFTEGTYSFVASRGGDACEVTINGGNTVQLTMIPEPTKHVVYADAVNVCGSVGTNVGLEDSEAGREYRIEDSTGAIQETIISESGEAISWLVTDVGTSEIYEIIAIADGGCELSMGTIEIDFKDAPAIPEYELSAEEYCEGANGITITIHNTESGIGYQLKGIDDKTYGFDDGNGGDIVFENIEEGEYYIIARNYESGCATYTSENIIITMNANPDIQILQIGTYDCSDICYGLVSSDELVLDNSAPEVDQITYSLLLDGLSIIPAVDSIGNGGAINYGSRVDAGIYTVMATSTKGCTSMMDGTVYLEEFPLNAEDDYLVLTKGENAGSIIVSGLDETVNDTWNVSIDILGDAETGDDGNLRFWFDPNEAVTSTEISSGSVTIDEISSVLVYTKKPGFYGKDSVQYYFKNIDYLAPRERIDSAWVHIYVGNKNLDSENAFLIPNAFSPNGDGINDYFKISGIEEAGVYTAEKSKLEVFNRWGALVYRSTGDSYGDGDEWWDGTSTTANMVSIGSDLPNGTYFYVYTVEVNIATESSSKVKEYSGYIELRR